MLDLKNLKKTFNAKTVNEKVALNGLNLHLNDNDFVTVIGGNGAGKSTMLNAIAGVWPIDQGSIVISGRLMEVMRVVAAENPIIISMAGKMTQAIRFLKQENDVKSMAIKGNDIMINFSGSPKAEADLLKRMIDSGIPVRSFSREKGSLESIFMQLTGHGEEHTASSYDATESNY